MHFTLYSISLPPTDKYHSVLPPLTHVTQCPSIDTCHSVPPPHTLYMCPAPVQLVFEAKRTATSGGSNIALDDIDVPEVDCSGVPLYPDSPTSSALGEHIGSYNYCHRRQRLVVMSLSSNLQRMLMERRRVSQARRELSSHPTIPASTQPHSHTSGILRSLKALSSSWRWKSLTPNLTLTRSP